MGDPATQGKIKVTLGEPAIVAVSTPGETRWGFHQFPKIMRLEDGRLALRYHVHADSTIAYGKPNPVSVSADGGRTWTPEDPATLDDTAAEAIVFPDGEAIRFDQRSGVSAAALALPPARARYRDRYTREADCYRLADLPTDLQRIPLHHRLPGEATWRAESAQLHVPDLCVQVMRREWDENGWQDPHLLLPPTLTTEFGWLLTPDGGVLLFTYLSAGGLFQADGSLPSRSPVVTLRSDDRGRSWRLWGIPGWFKDKAEEQAAVVRSLDNPNGNYNRLWRTPQGLPQPWIEVGGLYEPGVAAFADGRIICVMRTDSGATHEPCFLARSWDWGYTWTPPELLTPFGVMPKLVNLDNGVLALVYGRPGVQLLFCTDGQGEVWHTPLNLLPEPAEKTPTCVGRRGMVTTDIQVGHDDTCGNCTVLKTGPDRFLVAYSNFRYRNASGEQCKAICGREVVVGL